MANTWWQIEPDDTFFVCIEKILDSGDWQEPLAQYLAEVVWRFVPGGGGTVGEAPFDGQMYGRISGTWAVIPPAPVQEAPSDGQLYGRANGNWEVVIIPPGTSGIPEAPTDGRLYARENASWVTVPFGVPEAPVDGKAYTRQNASWVPGSGGGGIPEAPVDGNLYGRENAGWVKITITQGPTGPQGPAGTAATCDAGSTTTVPPGTNASVTNVGTTSAAIFNFQIPQGTPGVPGAAGATGPPGQSAYTLSTGSFTIPAFGSTIVVPVADTSWVALNEILWIQDAGGPGVAGPMQVTAKTPTSLTLLNIATSTVNLIVSSGWLAGANPNGATIFIANQARTIIAINGVVDAPNGAAATVSIYKAPSGTPIASGTVVHSGSFDANGAANTNQNLTLTVTTMNAGDRLGIVTTGTFSASAGNITIYVQ